MVWYLTGLAWLLQLYFWGFGLTFFVLPRRWWRFWPVFCPYAGIALQSSLVWGMARLTSLPGTDSYAAAGLLLPGGLLLAAARRVGGWRPLRDLGRAGWRGRGGCGWRWPSPSAWWSIPSPGPRDG